jgi:FkbM family methyltransferase
MMSPVVSYSIEAEDLVIRRLFNDVLCKGKPRPGYFIDIGAFHPIVHSNTYLLYTEGWRGLNIEPNPEYIEEFKTQRPDDVTINAAISGEPAKLTYHRFSNGLLNGFYGPDIVAIHVANGQTYLGSVEIDCISVAELLTHVKTADIDLLNIDIESMELTVLSAWDWTNRRPKIICVEIHADTIPNVLQSNVSSLLMTQGYLLVSRIFQSAVFVDGAVWYS